MGIPTEEACGVEGPQCKAGGIENPLAKVVQPLIFPIRWCDRQHVRVNLGGAGLDDQCLRGGVLDEESWVPRTKAMVAGNGSEHRSACAGLGPGPEQDISESFIKGKKRLSWG